MSVLSKEQIRELFEVQDTLCLSIYLPTYRAGAETLQNSIRYKNLVRRAEESLGEWGLDHHAFDALLGPVRDLADDADFWQHQLDGLAVFRSGNLFRTYPLPERFDEQVMVDDRFFLKPLFRVAGGDRHFYILALSRGKVRLLEADRYDVRELDLGHVPGSLAEALGEAEVQQTVHLNTRGPASRLHSAGPLFHGHGAGDTDIKEEVWRYFNRVEDALPTLDLDRSAPMVLAGVEYLLPIWREVTRWPNVLEQGITGNADELRPAELHKQALPLVEPIFRQEQEQAADRYGSLAGTGRASSQLEEVLQAAHDGRVDTLFAARGAHVWGFYDEENRQVSNVGTQQDGHEDLLDLAAVQTVLHGGKVFSVEPERVPAEGEPVAAVFRY